MDLALREALPKDLVAVHTKRNTIKRSGAVTAPETPSMNMSVMFEFMRRDSEKTYKLVVFSNGMAKIAGIKDCYACSEVPRLVTHATEVLTRCFGFDAPLPRPHSSVAMCNYVCEYPLKGALINLHAVSKAFNKSSEALTAVAAKHSLVLHSFKMFTTRNVACIKVGPV